MPGPNAIPVEAILKLALDKTGAQNIQDFLDKHESQWGRIEQAINRIGGGIERVSRFGLGLAGVAGVGAIARNFMQTSQAGSNVALAGGFVTGGPGTWHPYGQAMLAAQAKTGVAGTEIAQGVLMALQSVGGSPSPQQAAILGGLLAGYGQTVGLTPGQVAQVVAPLLQASHMPLSAGSLLGMGATLGLSAFPGSQAAPMLGVLSQLGVAQAVGGGPGFTPNLHGLAAAVNAAAQSNSLFRNPGIASGAINSISGGLQGAFGNPSQEAFLQMAGIPYMSQRQGFTPANAQKIMGEATRLYGTGITRDIFLRSMFGLQGADLLEEFAPGTRGAHLLQQNLAHHGSTSGLLNQIHHAQQRTTPNALANRAGGGILGWLESSPLHALLGAGGLLFGPKLLGKGASGLFGALRGLFGGAGGAAEDAAVGGGLDAVLGSGLGRMALGGVGGGVGALITAMMFPSSMNRISHSGGSYEQLAIQNVVAMAKRKFGHEWSFSPAARNWMQRQLYSAPVGGAPSLGMTDVWGAASTEDPHFDVRKFRGHAGQMLDQLLGDRYATQATGVGDPLTKLGQAADKLSKAADALLAGHKYASYTPGMGVTGIQSIGATAPGIEFAALTAGAVGGSIPVLGGGSSGSVPVSWAGGGGGPAGGGGWQSCTLTWYDPALGGINGGGTYADGGTYHASDAACAAPPQYPFGTVIQFSYRGRTVTCTVRDRGSAITGSHFDLTRGMATQLGMIGAGNVQAQFRVVSTGGGSRQTPGSSGGAGGGRPVYVSRDVGGGGGSGIPATVAAAAAHGAAGGGQPIVLHNHIYVDGRKQRTQRILLGHKH